MEKLLKMSRSKHPYKDVVKSFVKFLDYSPENNIIIDYHFGEYIRKHIKDGFPVLANFNFNMFHQMPKQNEQKRVDPFKGDCDLHEIVLYGYDENGVKVADSHNYTGKLKKLNKGRYSIEWEVLMTVMGSGDVVLPSQFQNVV